MHEILFFAVGASVAGTVFFVSALELIFTVRRRKVREQLEQKLKDLKTAYNQSINQIVLTDEAKIETAEQEAATAAAQAEEEKKALATHYEENLATQKETADKAVENARAKAKKMEQEAKMKADAYLESRKTEVEQELMNLVMNVTKKVLPDGLAYTTQKDLVFQALKEAKLDSRKDRE